MPPFHKETNRSVHKSLFNAVIKLLIYMFALIGFVLVFGYFAVRFGLTNEKGLIDNQRESFLKVGTISTSSPLWARGEEWAVLESAVVRDADTINRAARDADIDPRLIIAVLVPEQLRLFHDNREIFKQVFAPLKILGNQSQLSWGIMGIKRETAIAIEEHLKDNTSPFYLGEKYEKLLDFSSEDIGKERFARITDEKEYYYAYLYAALYLKQIMKQWDIAGFNIDNRPEISGTLYNIGFNNSRPNANPHSGGADIEINGTIYSFGSVAGEFYYSNLLRSDFL